MTIPDGYKPLDTRLTCDCPDIHTTPYGLRYCCGKGAPRHDIASKKPFPTSDPIGFEGLMGPSRVAERIAALIEETQRDLAFHRERRDRQGMSVHDRHRESIETSACRIRLVALEQCAVIVNEELGIKPASAAPGGEEGR